MSGQRTCLVCRLKRPACEMVRLVVLDRVRVDLDARLHGRGCWVCPSAGCAKRLEKRAEQIGRASRRPAPNMKGIRTDLRAELLSAARGALVAAHRAGGVVSGAQSIARAEGQPFIALVVALDAAPQAVMAARAVMPDVVFGALDLDRSGLGQLLGKGPRAVLAVRAGKLGNRFAHQLQCTLDLG